MDLTADILPPPLYLVEMYLVATQLSTSSPGDERKALGERLVQLEKDFNTRQEYWKTTTLSPEARKILDEELTPPGYAMIDAVNNQFLPVLKQGDAAGINHALAKVTESYLKHRAGVDNLVVLSVDQTASWTGTLASYAESQPLLFEPVLQRLDPA